MTDDYPRAMMEAWAELYGIPLLQGESDKDLSNRMSRAYIKPDDKSVHFFADPAEGFSEAQWMKGEEFGFEEPKETDEELIARLSNTVLKPVEPTLEKGTELFDIPVRPFERVWEMSKECQAQLVYWGKLHQLDRLPEETDHSFHDRLLLKAKRLVPQEPEETDEELRKRLAQQMRSEKFGFEFEEPRARFMNINPYLPRDDIKNLEVDVSLEKQTVFIEVNGVELKPLDPFPTIKITKKKSVMDVTRDFIKGKL